MKQFTIILAILSIVAFIQSASAQDSSQNVPICNGMATYLPKPELNKIPKDANISGRVNVKILIDENGKVEKAQAVSGHPILRKLAEEAAMRAKFRIISDLPPVKFDCFLVYNFVSPKDTPIITAEFPQNIIISIPKPDYPKSAKFVNASGEVTVEVIVDENGNVESANAINGHPLLRSASEKAALSAKFKPTFLSGKPVRVRTQINYNFISDKLIESAVGDEIILGSPIKLPKPPFPSFSGKVGSTKPQVFVQIEIDENGNVTSAKGIAGHPALRAACEVAARSSKFSQTKISGVPVKAKAILLYEFNLDDDSRTITVKSIEAIKPN